MISILGRLRRHPPLNALVFVTLIASCGSPTEPRSDPLQMGWWVRSGDPSSQELGRDALPRLLLRCFRQTRTGSFRPFRSAGISPWRPRATASPSVVRRACYICRASIWRPPECHIQYGLSVPRHEFAFFRFQIHRRRADGPDTKPVSVNMDLANMKPIAVVLASLVVSGAALAQRPATFVRQISRDGRLISNARIEVTIVSPRLGRATTPRRPVLTNDNGRFVVTGLPPADRYAVRIIFPGGFSAFGYVDDVRAGDVRRSSRRCTSSTACSCAPSPCADSAFRRTTPRRWSTTRSSPASSATPTSTT